MGILLYVTFCSISEYWTAVVWALMQDTAGQTQQGHTGDDAYGSGNASGYGAAGAGAGAGAATGGAAAYGSQVSANFQMSKMFLRLLVIADAAMWHVL